MNSKKTFSLKNLQKEIVNLKKQKKKVVFTNGCFDLIHAGHVRYLTEARNLGDALVVAGGVAANGAIRARLGELAADKKARLIAPPVALCTDNAAMIAWAGVERLKLDLTDGLDFAPRPRWPLDPDAPAAIYAGVKA